MRRLVQAHVATGVIVIIVIVVIVLIVPPPLVWPAGSERSVESSCVFRIDGALAMVAGINLDTLRLLQRPHVCSSLADKLSRLKLIWSLSVSLPFEEH